MALRASQCQAAADGEPSVVLQGLQQRLQHGGIAVGRLDKKLGLASFEGQRFQLADALAALGGVLSASRLASSSQQAGTGDVNLNAIAAAVIGGTSLFGGRGSAYSALLGIIVIQAISNGLTLLNLSSSLRYMITGGVLAIAVIVDSLARRSRVSHGRA